LLGGTSKVGGGNEAEKVGKLFKQINMLMGSFGDRAITFWSPASKDNEQRGPGRFRDEMSWTICEALSFGPCQRSFSPGFPRSVPLRGCNLPSAKSAGGPSIFERPFPTVLRCLLVGVQPKLVACAIE